MRISMAILITLCVCGNAVADDDRPQVVRLRFVPEKPPATSVASGSRLGAGPGGCAMIDAGIDDTFPVQDKDGHILFDLVVIEACDAQFVVEVRSKDAPKTLDLQRDKPVTVQVAGNKYELLYPTVYVTLGSKTTTSRVLLTVKPCP